MTTITVRVELADIQKARHEVLSNIKLTERMKAAGIPVAGKLIATGVTRGTLTQHVEEGLDGDEMVYVWQGDGSPVEDEL